MIYSNNALNQLSSNSYSIGVNERINLSIEVTANPTGNGQSLVVFTTTRDNTTNRATTTNTSHATTVTPNRHYIATKYPANSTDQLIRDFEVDENGPEVESFYINRTLIDQDQIYRFRVCVPLSANYNLKDEVKALGAEYHTILKVWFTTPLHPINEELRRYITTATWTRITQYRFSPDWTRVVGNQKSPLIQSPTLQSSASFAPDSPKATILRRWRQRQQQEAARTPSVILLPAAASSATPTQATTNATEDDDAGSAFANIDDFADDLAYIAEHCVHCPKCKSPIDVSDAKTIMIRCGYQKCDHVFCKVCFDPWTRHNAGTGGLTTCKRVAQSKQDAEKCDGVESINQNLKPKAKTPPTKPTKPRKLSTLFLPHEESDEDSYKQDSWCNKSDHSDSNASYKPTGEESEEESDFEDDDIANEDEDEKSRFSDDYRSSEHNSSSSSDDFSVEIIGTHKPRGRVIAKQEPSSSSDDSSSDNDVQLLGTFSPNKNKGRYANAKKRNCKRDDNRTNKKHHYFH